MTRRIQSERFVLYSPDPTVGVFLGDCLGLGFWSLMAPTGQEAAVTFATEAEAAEFVASWSEQPSFPIEIRSVEADDGAFASVAACVRASLPSWDPSADYDVVGTMVSRSQTEMLHVAGILRVSATRSSSMVAEDDGAASATPSDRRRHRRNGSVEFFCGAVLAGGYCRCTDDLDPACDCDADSVSRSCTMCLVCLDDMYATRDGSVVRHFTADEVDAGRRLDREALANAKSVVGRRT